MTHDLFNFSLSELLNNCNLFDKVIKCSSWKIWIPSLYNLTGTISLIIMFMQATSSAQVGFVHFNELFWGQSKHQHYIFTKLKRLIKQIICHSHLIEGNVMTNNICSVIFLSRAPSFSLPQSRSYYLRTK